MDHTVNPVNGLATGLAVSLGILFLLATITILTYLCARTDPIANPISITTPNDLVTVSVVGLDETTLQTYPKLVYGHGSANQNGSTIDSTCSICLGEFEDLDRLRLLPDCGHFFHVKCVDCWLRLNPTCPICRSSPLLTPISTPRLQIR